MQTVGGGERAGEAGRDHKLLLVGCLCSCCWITWSQIRCCLSADYMRMLNLSDLFVRDTTGLRAKTTYSQRKDLLLAFILKRHKWPLQGDSAAFNLHGCWTRLRCSEHLDCEAYALRPKGPRDPRHATQSFNSPFGKLLVRALVPRVQLVTSHHGQARLKATACFFSSGGKLCRSFQSSEVTRSSRWWLVGRRRGKEATSWGLSWRQSYVGL